MAIRKKKTKRETMNYETLYRKLKIEQNESPTVELRWSRKV